MAMRQGNPGTVSYLLGDHLGSTSVTANSSGSKVAELRYYPWGGTRYTYGTTPTSYQFTGQRNDSSIGLYFYNARYYDSALGRFIQADTIIPDPANPQTLNRYSYAQNNPLRYTDPTGHMSEWEWQNRWYNAHGFFWDPATGFWSTVRDPIFADIDIAREVIGEAGIELGGWDAWSADNIQKVAFGVAKYGQKLGGGISALKDLLGGKATLQLAAKNNYFYCAGGKGNCAPPSLLHGGGNHVFFDKNLFDSYGLVAGAQVVVHELAHIIDWQNNLSRAWTNAHDPLTQYATDAPNYPIIVRRKWEVWADAVEIYIFGSYDVNGNFGDNTHQVLTSITINGLNVQMGDMQRVLEGW